MADEGDESNDLQRDRLLQEKEAKDRELALKEREIEYQHQEKEKELSLRESELVFQRQQTWWTRWSTPAVVAIVAGLIGYVGTLITSFQSRQLEREKQEATLILEAIKTGGTTEEKTRQAAANLVFLADARLITTIKAPDLEKLRVKAQGAGPSLPSSQGVTFQRSQGLNEDLQLILQSALKLYQTRLSSIGYDLGQEKNRVTVQVSEDPSEINNATFLIEDDTVVIGENLASDPEYLLSEYTWEVLKLTNPRAFEVFQKNVSVQPSSFLQGLEFYLTCSYLDEPLVGKNYRSLTKMDYSGSLKTVYLFDLGRFKAYDKTQTDEHEIGEVWGGALWELRGKLGRERADKLVFAAWKHFTPAVGELENPKQYVTQIVQAGSTVGADVQLIQNAFDRRNLK